MGRFEAQSLSYGIRATIMHRYTRQEYLQKYEPTFRKFVHRASEPATQVHRLTSGDEHTFDGTDQERSEKQSDGSPRALSNHGSRDKNALPT